MMKEGCKKRNSIGEVTDAYVLGGILKMRDKEDSSWVKSYKKREKGKVRSAQESDEDPHSQRWMLIFGEERGGFLFSGIYGSIQGAGREV